MSDWDSRWMDVAKQAASWSKDRSTKVGAVIVGADNIQLSLGYNGFVRGVADSAEWKHERPAKYFHTEHAERNAIYNAARHGVVLKNATMFVTMFPCADCMRGIIQCGIRYLVAPRPDMTLEQWAPSWEAAWHMMAEAGVRLRHPRA